MICISTQSVLTRFDLPSGVGRKTKRGIWIICYDAGISRGGFVQLMEKMVFKEESYSF